MQVRDVFFDIGRFGIPSEVQIIPWVLAVIWGVFVLENLGMMRLPAIDPRGNILTIVTANLGHQGWKHIASNSIGVIFLLYLYMTKTPDPWLGLVVMFLGSTGLFWLFGPSDHNHGRGLSYALYALNGWILVWIYDSAVKSPDLKTWALLAIGTIVVIRGSIPGDHNKGIAWSGHLSGLIAGLLWSTYYFGYLGEYVSRYLDLSRWNA